jgi:phosphinothricin acetyltransferase
MSQMSAPVEVRLAQAADMPAICEIVNHYIETTRTNFRTKLQTTAEWTSDWEQLRDRYPWLVATLDGGVVGAAYAGPWKARNAYDWCAEATVYVDRRSHRRGIGGALYGRLLPTLDAQGYRTTVGVIALPNPPSVALHEAFGFEHAGTLRAVGYKMGQWCDVGFWQRMSIDSDSHPGPPLPVAERLTSSV